MANNVGKKFEEDIKKSAEKLGIYILRLKDSTQSFMKSNSKFSWDNHCDFIITGNNKVLFLELKSTNKQSISFNMIRDNQIQGLLSDSKYDMHRCGFLFNFRDENITYYMSIENFVRFRDSTNKKSINKKDIIDFNGIILEQELKRTRYFYRIDKLIENI